MKKIKLATIFSGIGAVEFALKRMNVDYDIVFACDNGEREIQIDQEEELAKIKSMKTKEEKHQYVEDLYKKSTKKKNFVQESYLSNYPKCTPERFYQDVRLLDGTDFTGEIDLFVGGSPCQSFSKYGQRMGLDDTRGTLFYDFARLVSEVQPKVFIYENVKNLIDHDNGKTWEVVKNVFDSLGYHYKFGILNASDYGVPQTRRRLFVVGFKEEIDFLMPPPTKELKTQMKDYMIDNCAFGYFTNICGEINIENVPGTPEGRYYLSPAIYNYVMCPDSKGFHQKVEINKPIARTIVKTIRNCHRASIDNYFSSDGSMDLGKVRMLTQREAHRLMGFTDDYQIVVSRVQAYLQAGNSIVVDVLIAILKEIFLTGIFNE